MQATSRRDVLGRLGRLGGALLVPAATACGWRAAPETPGAATGPAFVQPTRITVYSPADPPEHAQLWSRRSEQVRERNPAIAAEDIAVPSAGSNAKLLDLLAAGTPPDVLNVVAGEAEDLATRQALLPLDDLLRSDPGLGWHDFWPTVRASGQFRGGQVALPNTTGLNVALMFFNKALFQAAGQLTPEQLSARGRWTWQTLADEAARLTRRTPSGELLQAGLSYPWETDVWAALLLRGFGASYLNRDATRVMLDGPPAVQALRIAQDLAAIRRTMPLRGEGDSVALAKAGRAAQGIYWMTAAAWWRATTLDWAMAPTPAGPVSRATTARVTHLAIARATPAPNAAWAYLRTALHHEIDLEQAIAFGTVVLRRSSLETWLRRMVGQWPGNVRLVEAAARLATVEPLRPVSPQRTEVHRLFMQEIEALLHGGRTAEEVVRTLATEGNRLLQP